MVGVGEAKLFKENSQKDDGGLTPEMMQEIVCGVDREHKRFTVPMGSVKKYVPKGYLGSQIKDLIVKVLKQHCEKSQRNKNADER